MKEGWKCPECGAIINPEEKVCPICSIVTIREKFVPIEEVKNPWNAGPHVTMYAVSTPDMILRYGVGIK